MTLARFRSAVAALAAAALLSACAAQQSPERSPERSPAQTPDQTLSEALGEAPPGRTTGTVFYSALRPPRSASLTEEPASLADAYTEATAVVEADVVAVTPGRVIGKPPIPSLVVDLRVRRLIRGDLQPGLDRVGVEFLIGEPPIQPVINRMLADLPRDRAVWLLRWQGAPPPTTKPGGPRSSTGDPARYHVVHPNCGVLAEGPEGVHAPAARIDPGDQTGTAHAEAQQFRSLDDLIAAAVRR